MNYHQRDRPPAVQKQIPSDGQGALCRGSEKITEIERELHGEARKSEH